MMVLFHNTECGNKGNKLKSWLLLLLLSLFPSDCIGLAYERLNERLKPEDSRDEILFPALTA